jgi:S-methyl-5-thioribose-1-phosphate isomerase
MTAYFPAGPDVLAWRNDHIEALDQTVLPHEVRTLRITTVDELITAITRLAIRGAPVLGAAGALGVALAVRQGHREGWDDARLTAEIGRIAAARPTAVNLAREVGAMTVHVAAGPDAVEAAALAALDTADAVSHQISARGAACLRDACGGKPLRVHTHCNTGSLACLGWGTALGVIRALHAEGALDHVIVDETRPLLQGARLTCWELAQLGIEHRLACDGAAPFLISQGLADAVVVGADRIAANGDVANKIGTYSLALAADRAGIPFVVAAPESTIDQATPSGAAIPIEQRPRRGNHCSRRTGGHEGTQLRLRCHPRGASVRGHHREKSHTERPVVPLTSPWHARVVSPARSQSGSRYR